MFLVYILYNFIWVLVEVLKLIICNKFTYWKIRKSNLIIKKSVFWIKTKIEPNYFSSFSSVIEIIWFRFDFYDFGILIFG